jgi:hypothetical protein
MVKCHVSMAFSKKAKERRVDHWNLDDENARVREDTPNLRE